MALHKRVKRRGKKKRRSMTWSTTFIGLELIHYQRKLSLGLWSSLIFSQQDKFVFTLWHDFVLAYLLTHLLSLFLPFFIALSLKKTEYILFPLYLSPDFYKSKSFIILIQYIFHSSDYQVEFTSVVSNPSR